MLGSVVKNLLQIAAIAAVSFFFFFFIVPNQPERGAAFAVFAVGGGTAIGACWTQRHHAWFWFTLACVFVVQGTMLFFIPWSTERFPGAVLVPLGLADFAFVYGILTLIRKVTAQGGNGVNGRPIVYVEGAIGHLFPQNGVLTKFSLPSNVQVAENLTLQEGRRSGDENRVSQDLCCRVARKPKLDECLGLFSAIGEVSPHGTRIESAQENNK